MQKARKKKELKTWICHSEVIDCMVSLDTTARDYFKIDKYTNVDRDSKDESTTNRM